MPGTPGLGPPGGCRIASREAGSFLEDMVDIHFILPFFKEDMAHVFLYVLPDDENDFAESCLYGIIYGIVQDSFSSRSNSVGLFQPSVTAAYSGGKDE
jgi:hypothetical protein